MSYVAHIGHTAYAIIRPVENIKPRRRLRSASSAGLTVPATRRSTLGDRAFAVAGPRACNTLPGAIRCPVLFLMLYCDICIVSLKYFFTYGTLNLTFFTLHYITLHTYYPATGALPSNSEPKSQ